MIGCLRTHVCKQPIFALYFEFETVLKFYNLKAWSGYKPLAHGELLWSLDARHVSYVVRPSSTIASKDIS